MNKEQNKLLEVFCLAPFDHAEKLLLEAENLMTYLGRSKPGEKSEIRERFEEFEANLKRAWQTAFTEYGVDHVFALPIPVYRRVVEDYIYRPGAELMQWLSGKAAEMKVDPKENPYVHAGAALGLVYKLASDNDKEKVS